MRGRYAAVLLAVVVLAGCGDSDGDDKEKQLTVPDYGPFPAMTVPVTQGTPEQCRAEADAFSRAAEGFLRPFPSDADNYRVLARVQFVAFKAHSCDTAILRDRARDAPQRRAIWLGQIDEARPQVERFRSRQWIPARQIEVIAQEDEVPRLEVSRDPAGSVRQQESRHSQK